jgi:hypothetical protein
MSLIFMLDLNNVMFGYACILLFSEVVEYLYACIIKI